MIFDLHGQALVGRIQRRPFGNGPGFEHSFHLQAEIVMKACGAVALHHEAVTFALLHFGWRFRSFGESPLAFVFLEGHTAIVKKEAGRSGRSGDRVIG